MQILHRSRKGGFTLVELMVVIAIIAILTAIIVTGLVASRAKARDAKRASDLSQIQLAIEQFFDRCDQYPVSDSGFIDSTSLTQGAGVCPLDQNGVQITLASFISTIPTDPSTGSPYWYITNTDVNGTLYPLPTDYILYTKFEAVNSVLSQSAANPTWYPVGGSNFNCENQATSPSVANGLDYCIRPN